MVRTFYWTAFGGWHRRLMTLQYSRSLMILRPDTLNSVTTSAKRLHLRASVSSSVNLFPDLLPFSLLNGTLARWFI